MYTPFKKRATEYLRDGEPLLAVVTPDFFQTLLSEHMKSGSLFDRLTKIIGTPGSGKTTLSKLLQFENALIVSRRREDHSDIYDFLRQLGVIQGTSFIPARWITRLPMESEYREFWELPYEPLIKNQLLLRFVQARAVLGWIRDLKLTETPARSVMPLLREHSPAAIRASGVRAALRWTQFRRV